MCGAQGAIVAIENLQRKMYGLQYHPEVMHSERGIETIKHLLFTIAGLKATWRMEDVLEHQLNTIKKQALPPVYLTGTL